MDEASNSPMRSRQHRREKSVRQVKEYLQWLKETLVVVQKLVAVEAREGRLEADPAVQGPSAICQVRRETPRVVVVAMHPRVASSPY